MGTTYTISPQGQRAVDAGYTYCGQHCYRSVYDGDDYCGQLEVVIDEPGQHNGIDNKWVDVSYIKRDNLVKALRVLTKIGFKGCPAMITEEVDDGVNFREKELCAIII